jgi:hypothetical protein
MTPAGLRLLHDLRRQLLDPPTPLRPRSRADTPAEHPETVTSAA